MEASGWEADLKQEWCRALGMMHEGKEDATERHVCARLGDRGMDDVSGDVSREGGEDPRCSWEAARRGAGQPEQWRVDKCLFSAR